jgi:hypothetical protein
MFKSFDTKSSGRNGDQNWRVMKNAAFVRGGGGGLKFFGYAGESQL